MGSARLLFVFTAGLCAAAGCEGGLRLPEPAPEADPSSRSGAGEHAAAGGLLDRDVDHLAALRAAALALRGELPPAADQARLEAALRAGRSDGSEGDPGFVYGDLVRGYLGDRVHLGRQMVQLFRGTLRMAGEKTALFGDSATEQRTVSLETGPALAARLVLEERDIRLLFTQDRNTCPTFDAATGAFSDGACLNGVPEGEHAGILTNPGFLSATQPAYSDMGFARMVLFQEIFACSAYPGEISPNSSRIGAVLYHSPWPPSSITSAQSPPAFAGPRRLRGGGTTTTTQFTDFTAECGNCHGTMNHRAPVFARFDQVGHLQDSFMVTQTRAPQNPFAQIQEYLPAGQQQTAWKLGAPASSPVEFGRAMAADPEVIGCLVARFFNHAHGRGDIVTDQARVPASALAGLLSTLRGSGYNIKKMLLELYTSAAFLRP